jgi:hypothetical protein
MNSTLHTVRDDTRKLEIGIWTLLLKAHDGDIASLNIGVKLLIPGSEIQRVGQDETTLDHLGSSRMWREIPTNEAVQRSTRPRKDGR